MSDTKDLVRPNPLPDSMDAWVPSADSGETLPLINPSDGSEICHIARGSEPRHRRRCSPPAQAALQGDWGRMTALERGRILTRLGSVGVGACR